MRRDGRAVQPSRGAAFIGSALLLLLFGTSAFFSYRISGERSPAIEGRKGKESLLLAISRRPSFAFGFRNVFADAAWLEAVQIAGLRRIAPADYDRFSSLIETVNNFDPKFDVPYFLGGLILADSPAHVPDALMVLGRGKAELPSVWRIPFYEGYIRYFSQGDPLSGGMALEAASRVPGSPSYLPLLAARMFAEGRRPEMALQFLAAMAKDEMDPARLRVLENRMRDVETERDIQGLERAVDKYRKMTNADPRALSDLVAAGLIAEIPHEPRDGRYFLAPDGSVRSSRLTHRLKVFRNHATN